MLNKLFLRFHKLNSFEHNILRLAVVVKDSIDAMSLQDLEGNILAWNNGPEKMYGYPETQALTVNVLQITPPKNEPELHKLPSFIPVCMHCKNILDDARFW